MRAASPALPCRTVRAGLAFAWIVAAAAVWAGPPALAQTAIGGPQYQGGAGHPGFVATGPEPAYRTAWTAPAALGGPRGVYGLSAPIVQGDLAIAVGSEQVIAVDTPTGATSWTADRVLGPSVPPAVARAGKRTLVLFTQGWGSGPPDASVSPTASGSPSPSTGSKSPPSSQLVALDLASRIPVWTLDLPGVSRTGVTVEGGAAYVGTNDGTVTAVDLATGTTRWTHVVEGTLETTPAAANGLVLVTSRGHNRTAASVTALHEQDGSQAWRFQPSTSAVAAGPPALSGDTGYVAFTDQTVRAFSLEDGSQRWSSRLNSYVNFLSPVAVTPDAVIAVDISGQVYAFDPSTGARRWDFALNTSVFRSPPIVVGGFVLVPTAGGDLDVIELSSGDLVWQSTLADGPLRDLAVSGDTIVGIAGGTDAGVIGLAHDPAGTLVRIVTPTKLDPARVGLSWALAAVPFAAIVVFLGRLLVSRLGPAPLPAAGDDEIEDPWEVGVHPEDEP